MVAFLFWNLNRKPLETLVADLALQYEVDVVMLAECSTAPDVLLRTLNRGSVPYYHYVPRIGCEKIEIFTRFSEQFLQPKAEGSRYTIRHLRLPAMTDILLAIVHFPSKLHWSEDSQNAECGELSQEVKGAEKAIEHSRTALVGDLNMNPFQSGVVNANGLHGVMCQRIAKRKERTVQERKYPFFYNPMWNFFGDMTPGPPGTYYISRSEHTAFFWHMYDQVLIRPDLLPYFNAEDLVILRSAGDTSLLTRSGLPDKRAASDHLPILFRLGL